MEISVIIPISNSELYLKQCLSSVINQNFDKDYEIICALNNSQDSSIDIIKEYQTLSNKIKLIELPPIGVCLARIEAIKIAKGNYIAFLDSDDYYHESYLKTMYETACKGNYDIVNCSFFVNKENHISKNHFVSNKEYDSISATKALLLDKEMRSFLWTKLIKKELLNIDNLYYPKNAHPIFEDLLMLYGVFMNAHKVKSIDVPLYYYRSNPKSITKKENKDRFNFHLYTYAFIRHISDISNNNLYVKNVKKAYLRILTNLWFDAFISRHALNCGAFTYLYKRRKDIRKLKASSPLPVKGECWETYITEAKKKSE